MSGDFGAARRRLDALAGRYGVKTVSQQIAEAPPPPPRTEPVPLPGAPVCFAPGDVVRVLGLYLKPRWKHGELRGGARIWDRYTGQRGDVVESKAGHVYTVALETGEIVDLGGARLEKMPDEADTSAADPIDRFEDYDPKGGER